MLSITRIGRACMSALCLLLLACGGGSSGGNLGFSLDRSAVSFDFVQNESPPTDTVTATAQGSFSGTLYVAAIVEGTGIDPDIMLMVDDDHGTFTIRPSAGLAPGTYTGRILLLACSDVACNRRIGGTPLPVSFSVIVRPALATTPSPIVLSAISGSEAGQTVQLQLPNGPFTYTASLSSNPGNIFRIEDLTGDSLRVAGRSLPPGTYTGMLQIQASVRSIQVPITYSVTSAGPVNDLQVSPAGLTFSATEGAVTPSQLITLTPASWDPRYQVTIQYGSFRTGWLTLTAVSGGYAVVADARNLPAGNYSASIAASGEAPVSSRTVNVSLTVGAGLVRPADIHITANAETTASQLSGSVPVNLVSGEPVAWTATAGAPWLTLTRNAGNTGTSLNYTISESAMAVMANATTSTTHVTITPAVGTIAPQTFAVSLRKDMPRLTGLGPYLHVSGLPLRMIVRGSGFSAIANLASRVTLTGISSSALTFTPVNDSQFIVTAPAQVAQQSTISIGNALDLAPAAKVFRIIDPQTYDYARLATGGHASALVWDAQRRQAYLSQLGNNNNNLRRFSFNAGNSAWSDDFLPVTGLVNIGLSNDGSDLLVVSADSITAGTLRMLDPASPTFAQRLSFAYSGFLRGQGPVPVTNDGRIWLADATLRYLDPFDSTFQPAPLPAGQAAGSPDFVLSRNGERMVVRPDGPPATLLRYEATSGLPFQILQAPATFIRGSSSDTGNRVLLDDEVWDQDFSPVGAARIPSAHTDWIANRGVVSPDGNRVYRYAFRTLGASTYASQTRVYVFDSSVVVPQPATLPLVGHFELSDNPNCTAGCAPSVEMTISPDGQTLFISGNESLLVVPVPAEGTLVMSSMSRAAPAARQTLRVQPWNLQLR